MASDTRRSVAQDATDVDHRLGDLDREVQNLIGHLDEVTRAMTAAEEDPGVAYAARRSATIVAGMLTETRIVAREVARRTRHDG